MISFSAKTISSGCLGAADCCASRAFDAYSQRAAKTCPKTATGGARSAMGGQGWQKFRLGN
jgi:hypothetical protein